MDRKIHGLEDADSQGKKCLLSISVSTVINVFVEDDPEHSGAAAFTDRNAASGPKRSPEPASEIFCEDEDTPEDDYDAHEDPDVINSVI